MAMSNDYFVIKESDLSQVATHVVEYLNNGCELVGGISAVYISDNTILGGKTYNLQAMIDKTHNSKQ